MRCLARLTAALALLATPLSAQDLISFDRSDFDSIVLSRKQSAGIVLESAVGSYNNESILNYSTGSVFARLGRAVGRLDVLTDVDIFPCTAFIIDERHILTNYHCVPGVAEDGLKGSTRIETVRFVAGYVQQGVVEGAKVFQVSPVPVESDRALDFAVLEVFGNPSATFGRLTLSDQTPHDNDPYWVIGHPMGEAQRISREKCRADAPAVSGDRLRHTCDTLPGNSGSPVIDASLQKVVALHHAGSARDSVNFAIPMQLILKKSRVLLAALDAPGSPVTDASPDPALAALKAETAVCNALYAEARATKDCLIYEALSERCASHPLAAVATTYLRRNCAPAIDIAALAPAPAQREAVAPPPQPAAKPPVAAAPPSPAREAARTELKTLTATIEERETRTRHLAQLRENANYQVNSAIARGKTKDEIAKLQGRLDQHAATLAAFQRESAPFLARREALYAQVAPRTGGPAATSDWEAGTILPEWWLSDLDKYNAAYVAITMDPAGNTLAASDDWGQVRVWSLETGALMHSFKAHRDDTRAIDFAPDGQSIATGGDDNKVRIHPNAPGAPIQDLNGHDRRINAVAFSPDGTRVASASHDKTVRVWDTGMGRELLVLQGHSGAVFDVAFSPDGTRIYSASTDKSAIAWNARTGAIEQRFTGHEHWVQALAVSPDGATLLTGGADETMRRWDTRTGKLLDTIAFDNWVEVLGFGPTSDIAAVGLRNGAIQVWNLAAKRKLQSFTKHGFTPTDLALSAKGHRIALATLSGTVLVYRLVP